MVFKGPASGRKASLYERLKQPCCESSINREWDASIKQATHGRSRVQLSSHTGPEDIFCIAMDKVTPLLDGFALL